MLETPSAANSTIRARCANPAGADEDRSAPPVFPIPVAQSHPAQLAYALIANHTPPKDFRHAALVVTPVSSSGVGSRRWGR